MTGEAEFDEVFFTDVRLPDDALLGPLHGGWGWAWRCSPIERGHQRLAIGSNDAWRRWLPWVRGVICRQSSAMR